MFGSIALAVIALVGKVFDFLNPWSPYWVEKLKRSDARKEAAQVEIEKEVKNEGQESMDNYWNARARKRRR